MINHTELDNIQLSIEDIRSHLNDLPSEYDAVEYIRQDCRDIDGSLSCLEYEDDVSDWTSMIPDNLSAGEADSLRDAVNDWRVKSGYPESRPKPAEDIFVRISEELAKGTVPWHKPWVVRPECVLSYDSGKPYSLRNRMLLSFAGEYATFHQIKKLGGSVNKGAKGKWVYFSKEVKRKKEDEEEKDSFYHLLKSYCVFNICDTRLEPKWSDKWSGDKAPDCDAMQIVRDYCERTGVVIHEAGAEAFYFPSSDELQVPNINTFENEVEFYSTLFHEVAHSTGKRLGREYGVAMLGMADDKYCREELVAEITAALCLGHLGLDTEDTVINSAAYISSWQKNLSQIKPTEFGDACYQAQRAFNLIFNINNQTKE